MNKENILQFLRNHFVVFIVVFLITLFSLFYLLINTLTKPWPQQQNNIQTTVTPTAPLTPPENLINPTGLYDPSTGAGLEALKQNLPYVSELFNVVYLPELDKVVVIIKQNPFEVNKQKAIAWLQQNGVSDPTADNIEFDRGKGVE